ncbi:hypothetical protein [Variovorax sp. 38R]|uniref:hypothetical protein n=1 Tax=Variovorax sp. 38R TaxID=2774875 RepID=UPI00177C9A2B|nr:hypothetical protein [Variovorax sp. 38R]QOF76338.1 hypothetical protein IG196_18320 [Variovorax sp. 38R]
MKFEGQNFSTLTAPSDRVLESRLLALRSYGRHSFASLTDDQGNYLQVAGGGVTCMVERFDALSSTMVRAFHDKPSPIFPDGTMLAFGAGELRLMSDKWFQANAVVAIFLCFKHCRKYPVNVHWRPALSLGASATQLASDSPQ